MDNSCRSRDSNPQPPGTSPTLYPLEPRLPSFYVFLEMSEMKWKARCSNFITFVVMTSIEHMTFDVIRYVSFFDVVVINYLAICSAYPRLLGGPTQNGRGGGGGGCWRVWLRWKNGCNAFVCVSLRLNRARGKRSSLPRLHILSTGFCVSWARDCTIFTLHSLTDFYVERVTAHRIKRYDHSCFHNLWPNSKT